MPTAITRRTTSSPAVTGGGPDHKVTGEIQGAEENPHLQQAAGIMDVHAWVFNWLGAHPFHYHEQDWSIQEESETFVRKNEEKITFGDSGRQLLPTPARGDTAA